MRKLLLLFSLFFFSAVVLQAQSELDISLLKQSSVIEINENNFNAARNNSNEFELLFSGLFLFYKSVFSSQDVPGGCSFSPSCSEFGLLSIKKRGVFFGILNTFDRLTRCNGISQHQYTVDSPTGKYLDYP